MRSSRGPRPTLNRAQQPRHANNTKKSVHNHYELRFCGTDPREASAASLTRALSAATWAPWRPLLCVPCSFATMWIDFPPKDPTCAHSGTSEKQSKRGHSAVTPCVTPLCAATPQAGGLGRVKRWCECARRGGEGSRMQKRVRRTCDEDRWPSSTNSYVQ